VLDDSFDPSIQDPPETSAASTQTVPESVEALKSPVPEETRAPPDLPIKEATDQPVDKVARQIQGVSLVLQRVEQEVRKASILVTYACVLATVAVLRL
jgi:hypothetical protein